MRMGLTLMNTTRLRAPLCVMLLCLSCGSAAAISTLPSGGRFARQSRTSLCNGALPLHCRLKGQSYHGGIRLLPSADSRAPLSARARQAGRTGAPTMAASLSKSSATATAVYALILANLLVFVADKAALPFVRTLYLYHRGWAWWQPLSACFCHASRSHLSGNLFLLLLFGRSVEDELGWFGLLFAYCFCGVVANIVSLALLPAATVSLGASGAVFGLFAVSVLSRLSWRSLDWRRVVELTVLGEFTVCRVLSELQTAASGGVAGINHVAHLSGAASGALLVFLLRRLLGSMEDGPAAPARAKR